MERKSTKICKFYKSGKCRHGKSGRTTDQNGKICEFTHPPTCKKFEFFGYKENGCRLKKCDKLHLSLCKGLMKDENCKFGDKCRYWHPKKLKNIDQNRENKT